MEETLRFIAVQGLGFKAETNKGNPTRAIGRVTVGFFRHLQHFLRDCGFLRGAPGIDLTVHNFEPCLRVLERCGHLMFLLQSRIADIV